MPSFRLSLIVPLIPAILISISTILVCLLQRILPYMK